MDVKAHLKQICKLEQAVKEAEMKILKHKAKREETANKIAERKAELENNIAQQRGKIKSLTQSRSRRANYKFAGTKKEKKTTMTVCAITAIVQAILTAIMVLCFGANNFVAVSIAYTVIYALLIVFWLYLEYDMWFKFPIVKTILGVVILAVLYQATRWYFKTFYSIGINVIGANLFATLLILGVEILFGRRACNKAMNAQKQAYKSNQRWLQESEGELKRLQKELQVMNLELTEYNQASDIALAKMAQEIVDLENFLNTTKSNLKATYAQNILHPNYQNWVAASTIYEYLDIGRCYELKGTDGAYNLYERELLAKKILDSLSAIHSSINHHGSNIYSSQMYIRHQLSECNRNVERMVVNTYGF